MIIFNFALKQYFQVVYVIFQASEYFSDVLTYSGIEAISIDEIKKEKITLKYLYRKVHHRSLGTLSCLNSCLAF